MSIKLGTQEPKFMLGVNQVDKIYLGETEIWSNGPVISYLNKIVFPTATIDLTFVEGNNNGQ